jgi:branched-subunit amino acid aminotransferase/4-amino-4-deoxychorismate lyase
MRTDSTIDAPSDPHSWTWSGSEFLPGDGIPMMDRGFRYGMSVFESFPVHNGAGVFLDEHLKRLREACGITGFAVPPGALENCERPLKQAANGFGRIYITAGDGPVTGKCDDCRVFIFVESREAIPARVYHRGYDLAIHPGSHLPIFAGLKTGNYWGNLQAFRDGVAAHYNETLLFTPAGHLISACMANVFVLTGGKVLTPDSGTGAREGVVREWAMRHIHVEHTLITRADLREADEIFLTSSWLGIMPAASVDGRPLEERKLGAMLLETYRRDVHGKPE